MASDLHTIDGVIEGNARIAEMLSDRVFYSVRKVRRNIEAGKRRIKDTEDLRKCIKDVQDLQNYLSRVQGMLAVQEYAEELAKRGSP
jgi:uncharacterized protein (DUF885 family)